MKIRKGKVIKLLSGERISLKEMLSRIKSGSEQCNCQQVNCRKVIGNVLTIPRDILTYYYKIEALPDFIKATISPLLSKAQN